MALHSFEEFEHTYGQEQRQKQDISLKNIRSYLAFFDHPEKKLNHVIQVAGTNGKGSTAAMLQSLLTHHGFKIGLYTSPHLLSYTERFRLDDQDISQKKLLYYLNQVHINSNKNNLPLSLFEVLTCAAIHFFVDEKVDVAILETGLGGRLDATTAVPAETKVITSISIDHQDYLGDTLEAITREKAAIITRRSLVCTSNDQGVLKILEARAKEEDAKIFSLAKNPLPQDENYELNLLGSHQKENASLALLTLTKISKAYSLKLSPKKIKQAFLTVKWPGRFQIMRKSPLLIIDGAHNSAGIEALAKTIKELEIKNLKIFFAAKENKDVLQEISTLKEISSDLCYVKTKLSNMYPESKTCLPTIRFEEMLQEIAKKKGPILLCGSLYFLGEFLKHSPRE
ncbi:bifunctional folylpolyglutamate synthase/dihydrofolate synthase [Patescibacteria group bacterium]|nr:bifunctional folylpolyglutamate synthase/dihydrofolate synthase [Patescibacteria group bacterium]